VSGMRKKRKLRSRTGQAERADGADREPDEAAELAEDESSDESGADESSDEIESGDDGEPGDEVEVGPELDPDAELEPVQAEAGPAEVESGRRSPRRRGRKARRAEAADEAGADGAGARETADETSADGAGEGGDDAGEGAGDAGADEALAEDPDAELTPAFTLDPVRLKSILESLLFASEKPLTMVDLRRLTGCGDTAAIQAALDELMKEYEQRGVALYDVAGGFQFRTHPANSEYVQRLIAGRPVRLSRAQLETLAIIAYRQPVTRPEIDEIRGVDSGSTIKVLLDRSLIRVLGKKEEPGRPLLYGTSKEFLEFFNLRELRDLPSLREFHELTEESLREVEALDQAGKEDAAAEEGASAGSNGAGGEPEGDDPDDDSSSASAPH
jgi:segregation and condensation protein B